MRRPGVLAPAIIARVVRMMIIGANHQHRRGSIRSSLVQCPHAGHRRLRVGSGHPSLSLTGLIEIVAFEL